MQRFDVRQLTTALRSDYFILFVIATIYIVIVSTLALSRHYAFDTNTWDLGIYSQSLYSTINHGKLFYYTAELPGNPSGSLFGIHFAPILFLITPLYVIFQNPVTLLILRPIAISLGLIPLYWIIKNHQLTNRKLTFFLASLYLVYPPITTPLSNFDVEVFLPVLFLFAFHYLQNDKLIHSYLFMILALMVNEFVPLIVIALSVYVLVLHHQEIIKGLQTRKLTKYVVFAFTLLLTGILWFNLAGTIITSFNPNALNTKWEWGQFGTNPTEIVTNVVTNPSTTINTLLNDGQNKLLYLTALFGPLAFLSFLDPITLIATIPWLAASLLSVNPLYYTIGTQYPAFVSPFIFVSAVNGIKKLSKFNIKKNILNKIAFLMLGCLLVSTFLLPTENYFEVTNADNTTRTALTLIPADASVAAMPEVCPHLSNRLQVYPYFKDCVDYILVDIYSWWYTVTLPRPAHSAPKWCDAQISSNYGLILNANGILLYKNGYTGPVTYFEGISFTYTSTDVEPITGTVIQEPIPFGTPTTKTEVLLHNITDQNLQFFKISQKALPPGNYDLTAVLKTSSTTHNELITITALDKEMQSLFIQQIGGNDFETANKWQVFTFNFTINQPTFIEFTASATNHALVYFHSLNILQVTGGV